MMGNTKTPIPKPLLTPIKGANKPIAVETNKTNKPTNRVKTKVINIHLFIKAFHA